IKKDLEYVRTFQEKWRDQRERFPKIYEGILEQERFFLRKIDELKGLRVDSAEALAGGEPENTPQPAPAIVPAVEMPTAQTATPSSGVSTDSGDEKRAAAIDGIGEKLRKRQKETVVAAADAAPEAAK
ncbi:MAG TPA: hypothetical protein VHF22_10620, partial [Planctomycetota bacterium]|nr:hypothetical protein [Planctomycetota bacterium]